MKNFRNLEIWKKGIDLVNETYALTKKLPKEEQFGLKSQINRCVVSIPSNIAEGCSRSSDLELIRFLEIALGSAFELETQIIIVQKVYQIEVSILSENLTHLQKMINAYRSKIKASPNTKY